MLKFKGILDNATRADGIVREKYESNKQAIVILGKPLPEIQAAIPAGGVQAAAISGTQVREKEVEGETEREECERGGGKGLYKYQRQF